MSRAPRQRRSTTSHEIVDHVRSQIYTGGLSAGERINQDALAEEFGVSRLPVREALIGLESEGLVRSELHRGVYVIPITRADIVDHYTVYAYIQGIAAERATPLLRDEDLATLDSINDTLASTRDAPEVRDLDWQFHSIINRAGGSNRLLRILRQLNRAMPQELYAMPPAKNKLAVAEHRAIVKALRAQDAEAAGREVTNHTNREGEQLVCLLERDGVLIGENHKGHLHPDLAVL